VRYTDGLVCEANKYEICRILSKESLVKIAQVFQLGISCILRFTQFFKAPERMLELQKSQCDTLAQRISALRRLCILELNTASSVLA